MAPQDHGGMELVNQTFVSWNQMAAGLRRLDGLRGAA